MGFGGPEVYHQLVLGGCLHGQIGRLLTLEDAINVASGFAELRQEISGVGDQAAARDEFALGVNRWQLVLGGERNDELAMNQRIRTRWHDQPAVRACKSREITLDFGRVPYVDRAYLQIERRRKGLDNGKLPYPCGYSGVAQDGYSPQARTEFFEQLQPFPTQAVFELQEAC